VRALGLALPLSACAALTAWGGFSLGGQLAAWAGYSELAFLASMLVPFAALSVLERVLTRLRSFWIRHWP
jgi:hypothetical protein